MCHHPGITSVIMVEINLKNLTKILCLFIHFGYLLGILAIIVYFAGSWLTGDVDECKDRTHNCHPNASCIDTKEGYICTCNPGYTGNGTICSPIENGNGYFNGNISSFFTVAIIIFIFRAIWNKDDRDIQQRREKIAKYKPGSWTSKYVKKFERPPNIKIGVFGVQGSGKSSFLNSIIFAYTGKWEQVYVEGLGDLAGGETIYQDPAKLTDCIITVDTRGIVDLSQQRAMDVMAEIRGERGIDTLQHRRDGDKIDCPIFVFKYSPITGTAHCEEFLEPFRTEIKKRFGSYPLMVVTHADGITDNKKIRDEFFSQGMAESNVFFIENYTVNKHNEDKAKQIKLLEILHACIKRADDNIIFRWRRNHEPELVTPWQRLLRQERQDRLDRPECICM